MRSLLLAAALLVPAASARADGAAADWRRAGLSDAQRGALTDSGFRLADDGRVLDPNSGAPLGDQEFQDELARLGYGAQQSALERLSLLAAKGTLTDADRAALDALKSSLPDDAARALAAGAPASDLRRIADGDLAQIANYFDSARTPRRRASDAAPVVLGDPGPRVPLPYFTPAEKTLGDGLRAAASRALGVDPVGRTVLARLNGADGKPDLPPIVVEDSGDGAAADYNYRRRALVVDADTLRSSLVGGVPAPQRGALRAELMPRDALLAYANAHPDALAAFAAQNDALLAHELTHAWQDRRDPVMQEMSRDALPPALIVDDEVEAWTVKNLYIASRLQRDPRAAVDPNELADLEDMSAGRVSWQLRLQDRYASAAPNAMTLEMVAQLQARRLERTRAAPTDTAAAQAAKALDLLVQERAQRELEAARGQDAARLAALGRRADAAAKNAPRLLAGHFLALAASAANPTERSADLEEAENYARASGDARLLARVRALEKNK
jgi:hypothetical protein